MSIRRKLLKTVAWEPITWVPLTIATAITCLLRLPWWANVLGYVGAAGFAAAVWGRMLPRLLVLWETEEAKERIQSEETQRRAFIGELRASRLTDAAGQLESGYALREQILALIKANAWVDSFEYARNTLRLIEEMEQTARSMLVPNQNRSSEAWRHKKEALTACIAALEDTLSTVERTIKQTAAAGEMDGTSSVADQVIKKNRITRQVLKDMSETDRPPGETQTPP